MAKQKGGSIVSRSVHVLYVLRHCSPQTFKTIIKDKTFSSEIIKAVRELAYNYLYIDLPLTKRQKQLIQSKLSFFK